MVKRNFSEPKDAVEAASWINKVSHHIGTVKDNGFQLSNIVQSILIPRPILEQLDLVMSVDYPKRLYDATVKLTPAQKLISDDMIAAVKGNADFGCADDRKVMDDSLLQIAFGFPTSDTVGNMLHELGLVRAFGPQPGPTVKGQEYLRVVYWDKIRKAVRDDQS